MQTEGKRIVWKSLPGSGIIRRAKGYDFSVFTRELMFWLFFLLIFLEKSFYVNISIILLIFYNRGDMTVNSEHRSGFFVTACKRRL